jgi:hypothetical protein
MRALRWVIALLVGSLVVAGFSHTVGAQAGGSSGVLGTRYQVFVPAVAVARATPPVRYVASGVIWADNNGNGVRDAGERGVGGVQVTLTSRPVTPRTFPISGEQTVVTDAEGRYAFAVYNEYAYTLDAAPNPTRWTPTTPLVYDFQLPPVPGPMNIGLRPR